MTKSGHMRLKIKDYLGEGGTILPPPRVRNRVKSAIDVIAAFDPICMIFLLSKYHTFQIFQANSYKKNLFLFQKNKKIVP